MSIWLKIILTALVLTLFSSLCFLINEDYGIGRTLRGILGWIFILSIIAVVIGCIGGIWSYGGG